MCIDNGRYPCNEEGSPASPNTGALVEVNRDGSFTVIADGLDQPTSLEFIGNTAYVVTLTGEIWKIHGVLRSPHDSRDRYGLWLVRQLGRGARVRHVSTAWGGANQASPYGQII